MTTRQHPATDEDRAQLQAMHDSPMDIAEFVRLAAVPVTPAEVEEVQALVAWFTRRYPTGADRLAYVRRAYRRWTRAEPPAHG